MVRQLQPWFENLKKRQVRAPKIYLRDTGLLHSLLNISNKHELLGHPRLGASWEGFALEQVLSVLRPAEAYFGQHTTAPSST
jgi:predicted AAA+ superfamily ATPase